MMGSDIHHRTEDFRVVYRNVIADLKLVLGTSYDVLPFVASGTGAMEAAVSNLFSRGDKVVVCSAGKFGERWAEMTTAFGLDVTVLKADYGDAVKPETGRGRACLGCFGKRRVRAGLGDLYGRCARH
jgi:aspartate aminotransferase-like enzyme